MTDKSKAGADGASRSSGRWLAFNEIDLVEVIRDIWNAKYFILICCVIGFFYSILILSSAKPTYTANMTVSQSDGAPRPSGAIGQAAAMASSLGINISGASDDSNFSKFKALLDSDLLAAALFRRDDLKPYFFGPGWNSKTRTFSRPSGIVFNIKDFVKGALGLYTWRVPGPTEVRVALKSKMSFTTDKLTGLVKISVKEDSPKAAVFLLKAVSEQADELLRRATKERSSSRIQYLSAALAHTTMQDQREAIINILVSQQRNLMMASVDKNFSVDIIDPPSASSIPTSPVARVTFTTNILFLLVVSIFAAVIYGFRMRVRFGNMRYTPFDLWVRQRGSSIWRYVTSRRMKQNASVL